LKWAIRKKVQKSGYIYKDTPYYIKYLLNTDSIELTDLTYYKNKSNNFYKDKLDFIIYNENYDIQSDTVNNEITTNLRSSTNKLESNRKSFIDGLNDIYFTGECYYLHYDNAHYGEIAPNFKRL
jgi:hypothetical protein